MKMFRRLREKKTISNYVVTRNFFIALQLKKSSNNKQLSKQLKMKWKLKKNMSHCQ